MNERSADGHRRTTRRLVFLPTIPCEKTVFVSRMRSPFQVCPEPVLVKRSFIIERWTKTETCLHLLLHLLAINAALLTLKQRTELDGDHFIVTPCGPHLRLGCFREPAPVETPFPQRFDLCLSRACLGKWSYCMIQKTRKKGVSAPERRAACVQD